jgi:hypothetical protein
MRTKKLFSLIILLMLLVSPVAAVIYGDTADPENPEGTETEPEEEEVEPEEEETEPEEEETEEETEVETEDETEEEEDDEEGYDPLVLQALYENQEQIREQIMNLLHEHYGAFESLENVEDQIPSQIMNNIRHGDEAHDDVDNVKWSNPEAAANQIQRGMKHYANALKQIYQHNPDEELEGTEPQSEEEPEDEDLEVPDEEEIKEHKQKLMVQYQEDLADRIMEMTETMNQLMDQLGEEDQLKMFNAIDKTLRKLERIQERLSDGLVDEAVDLAEEAEEELEEAIQSMQDQQFAQMLRTMYRLEARIQKMEKVKNKDMEKGLDVEAEGLLIDELREALVQAKNDVLGGDLGGAEDVLGQASENAKGKNKDKEQTQ